MYKISFCRFLAFTNQSYTLHIQNPHPCPVLHTTHSKPTSMPTYRKSFPQKFSPHNTALSHTHHTNTSHISIYCGGHTMYRYAVHRVFLILYRCYQNVIVYIIYGIIRLFIMTTDSEASESVHIGVAAKFFPFFSQIFRQ